LKDSSAKKEKQGDFLKTLRLLYIQYFLSQKNISKTLLESRFASRTFIIFPDASGRAVGWPFLKDPERLDDQSHLMSKLN